MLARLRVRHGLHGRSSPLQKALDEGRAVATDDDWTRDAQGNARRRARADQVAESLQRERWLPPSRELGEEMGGRRHERMRPDGALERRDRRPLLPTRRGI